MTKTLLITFLLFALIRTAFAQAEIKFDSTVVDVGIIKEDSQPLTRIWFTNVGNDTTYVTRITVSDPGLISGVSYNPVAPGARASFCFSYFSHHSPGNFAKFVNVRYGVNKSDGGKNASLLVKGFVFPLQAKVCMDSMTQNAGDISFNDTATIEFVLNNCSADKLSIRFDKEHHESDLISVSIDDGSHKKPWEGSYNNNSCAAAGKLYIKIRLHNIFGNAGKFERTFSFVYNQNDILALTIRGAYVGKPFQPVIVNKGLYLDEVLEYKNNMLVKRTLQHNSKLNAEEYYEGLYCTLSIDYDSYTGNEKQESSYENGLLEDKKVFNSHGQLQAEYFYKAGKYTGEKRNY